MNPRKRLLLFATKLGYQTRSFNAAAKKLDVEIAFVTDRCGRMDDPWNDHALAAHFDAPETAAHKILEAQRGLPVDGILALGDRPAPTAAYVARGLGLRAGPVTGFIASSHVYHRDMPDIREFLAQASACLGSRPQGAP